MGVFKDLLYTKGNLALDITRVSVAFSVVCFWVGVLSHTFSKGEFDAISVGGGIAAVFTGAAGWMHFRQKQEGPNDDQSGAA